jgi:hypothetical protein
MGSLYHISAQKAWGNFKSKVQTQPFMQGLMKGGQLFFFSASC